MIGVLGIFFLSNIARSPGLRGCVLVGRGSMSNHQTFLNLDIKFVYESTSNVVLLVIILQIIWKTN